MPDRPSRVPEAGIHGVYTVLVARFYTHVISFRVSAQEGSVLQALRATFPEQKWGEAIRWLISHPAVKEAIEERIRAETRVGPDKSFGAEASLPVGDR